MSSSLHMTSAEVCCDILRSLQSSMIFRVMRSVFSITKTSVLITLGWLAFTNGLLRFIYINRKWRDNRSRRVSFSLSLATRTVTARERSAVQISVDVTPGVTRVAGGVPGLLEAKVNGFVEFLIRFKGLFWNAVNSSMGNGKMIVEFCSVAILLSVCR